MVATKQNPSKFLQVPPDGPLYDWRGTPINLGDTVIYGAPVGRSIALVEATVVGYSKSGRVWLNITRRAYNTWSEATDVHVGADRLTIVTLLPPSTAKTQVEVNEEREQRMAEYRARNPRVP